MTAIRPVAPVARPLTAPSPAWEGARHGARAMAPLVAAVAPFGIVVGTAISESSLDPGLGLSTGTLLYGGSAQLAAIALLSSGAPLVGMVVTVLAINARFALYGAALRPVLHDQPRWFRLVAAHLIVDPQYVVMTVDGIERTSASWRRQYYLGAAAVLWMGWNAATITGYVVGPVLPPELGLDVATPLYLTAVLVPRLGTRVSATAAAAGLTAAALGAGLPAGGGILAGVAGGMTAALAFGRPDPARSATATPS